MLAAAECPSTGVKRELRSASLCQLAGDFRQIRAPRDALVGDRVQPRQCGPHVNLAPAAMRAPCSQSPVVIRALPAGCTSKTSTVPTAASLNGPVAITREPSAESTSPGAPVPLNGGGGSITLGLKSLISTPFCSVHAPGRGARPRIRQAIARASCVQSMPATSRESCGAYL